MACISILVAFPWRGEERSGGEVVGGGAVAARACTAHSTSRPRSQLLRPAVPLAPWATRAASPVTGSETLSVVVVGATKSTAMTITRPRRRIGDTGGEAGENAPPPRPPLRPLLLLPASVLQTASVRTMSTGQGAWLATK